MEQATAPSPLLVPGRSTLTAMPILPLAAAPGQLRAPHETWNVMTQAPYELRTSPNGVTATIHARGSAVLASPTINRGTAFTLQEREALGLNGLLPTGISVETALRNTGLGPDDLDLLVATDSEGILGIGDQGIGGIEISIGKLSLYTAAAGIHPRRVLPVVLDMGTDNLTLRGDDVYLGARHARVRDQRYDDLIDAFVTAVTTLFPCGWCPEPGRRRRRQDRGVPRLIHPRNTHLD